KIHSWLFLCACSSFPAQKRRSDEKEIPGVARCYTTWLLDRDGRCGGGRISSGRSAMRTKHKPAPALSAAQHYLRLCGRAFLATAPLAELIEAAQKLSPEDWRLLFVDATAHGMASIAYYLSATSGALSLAPQD